MTRLEQLLAFLAEDPKDSFLQFALASEYAKLGEKDKALQSFESLLKNDPNYVGLYYHLGKLLEESGRFDDAIGVYRDGIEIAGKLSDFHARSELQSALLEAEMSEDL